MALSVALLWGCLIAEHVTMQRAATQQARVLRDLKRLRGRLQRPEPAFEPLRRTPRVPFYRAA